jgi:hypothetical protein
MQNEIAPLPFGVFQVFTVAPLGLLLLYFCKLPATVWPRHVKQQDGMIKPVVVCQICGGLGKERDKGSCSKTSAFGTAALHLE